MNDSRASRRFSVAQYIGFAIWALILFAFVSFLFIKNIHIKDLLQFVLENTTNSSLGVMVFFLAFAIRPVLFVPAILLSLLGGFLFGFWPGALYVLVGETISSNISYALGYFFGSQIISEDATNVLGRFKRHMHKSTFFPMLTMRLMFLPFEVVDYAAPLLGARWFPYFTGSLIGSIPSAITFASLGASVKNIDELGSSIPSLDMHQFWLSIFFLCASMVIGYGAHRWYKKRFPHHHLDYPHHTQNP